jgi:hypothetical protein
MISRFNGRELDDQEFRVLDHIERHGWSVTNIREQDGNPGWAFTVGRLRIHPLRVPAILNRFARKLSSP